MPASTSDGPSVALSFANNFWGKDDAGVSPMLERMHNAKMAGDEMKAFYTARIAIEEEYARKLLNLARKPLGSGEMGTLRMSLDVVRGEVESMGKAHQNITIQMKRELDEPLTAFTGGMKERRKIVQSGIERLLKVKMQQTATVNKSRDRFEQDCLKIKGYLAQGHMVMGQEERKNKAKLEKTQIQLSTNNNEYETAVRVLEETTERWNREWKAACDKFQDLEEERIDFMKSSLWTFANVASTVCVSDDASCEKIRLSLEDCDVEKDIKNFIRDCGTGQEIPDAPKYINFCRSDASDAVSEASDEGNYSVAQFQRTMNPAYRTSSPQPPGSASNYDVQSDQPRDMGSHDQQNSMYSDTDITPRKPESAISERDFAMDPPTEYQNLAYSPDELPKVPHNEYPMDGMTQFCRTGPPSVNSSSVSQNRPLSRDSQSASSNVTGFTSPEPSMGAPSPTKQLASSDLSVSPSKEIQKKRSGFFQNRSPFRRKSKNEKQNPYGGSLRQPSNKRNTWASSSSQSSQPPSYSADNALVLASRDGQSTSPEPVDPRASFQLNVGNNVFDVASPDTKHKTGQKTRIDDELDPIAKALAELKGISKESSVRVSADRYHGIATPAPSKKVSETPPITGSSRNRNTPQSEAPPSYDQPPMSRLGAPQPAFTSRQMQQTTRRFTGQTQNMFNSQDQQSKFHQSGNNGGSRAHSRATSPAPFRSTSPRPTPSDQQPRQNPSRAASPNPQVNPYRPSSQMDNVGQNRPRGQSLSPIKPRNEGYGTVQSQFHSSPGYQAPIPRAVSPQPQFSNRSRYEGAASGNEKQAMQLAQPNNLQGYQHNHQENTWRQSAQTGRPTSQYGGSMMSNEGVGYGQNQNVRSRSNTVGGQVSQDGRPILHFSRAMYMYQAAIPEELSFAKGDIFAVLRLQDDGWWEAEITGKRGRPGLVPSNYLTNC